MKLVNNRAILAAFLSSFGSAMIATYTFIHGHTDWSFIKTPESVAHFCWIIGSVVLSIYTALVYQVPIKLESVSEKKLQEIKNEEYY